jgi:hypothetical protein
VIGDGSLERSVAALDAERDLIATMAERVFDEIGRRVLRADCVTVTRSSRLTAPWAW